MLSGSEVRTWLVDSFPQYNAFLVKLSHGVHGEVRTWLVDSLLQHNAFFSANVFSLSLRLQLITLTLRPRLFGISRKPYPIMSNY